MDEDDVNRRLIELKLAKLKALEDEAGLRKRLPHLYSQKFYPWQKEFFDCKEKIQVLTAANQIGKSSTMIKKTIEWATNEDLWPVLWPAAHKEGQKPSQFWYCYPSKDIATAEYYDKWVPLLPPQDDPELGWKPIVFSKYIWGINFIYKNLIIYFKTYRQGEEMLQAGTAWVVVCDEELPIHLLPELQARVTATNGYMIFGFTATMGQEYWKQVVEDRSKMTEAWVKQVSLYDCQTFVDGTPTRWTDARIQQVIDRCTSKAEIARRVYGRFVKDEGLRFPTFDRSENVIKYEAVPKDWDVFTGIDFGSGGPKAHPSAIAMVAINPDRTKLRLVRFWRGDDTITTAQDVVNKYLDISSEFREKIVAVFYDYATTDLGTIAARMSLPFQKANKNRNEGIAALNTLFKTKALLFYDEHPQCETWKLVGEIESLSADASKADGYVADDGVDALRYCIMPMPINWSAIPGASFNVGGKMEKDSVKVDPRTGQVIVQRDNLGIDDEMAFWDGVINEY